MSNLILNQLKPLKPFLKAKGLTHEQYGVIKNGVLYYNNTLADIELPIGIPFDCCINLYELQTLLSSIKGETVIVNQDDLVQVICGDMTYTVSTMPINSLDNVIHFYNKDDFVECDNPQIFKQMMGIAESYVQPCYDVTNVRYSYESLIVYNNTVTCSDRYNIVQGWLDFAMPNLAILLPQIMVFNRIAKGQQIVGMNLFGNFFAVKFDNGVKVYIRSHYEDGQRVAINMGTVNGVMSKKWVGPKTQIPDFVKKQIVLLKKLTSQDTLYFTNSFCEANGQRIDYPSFGEEIVSIKCALKHLKTVFDNGNLVSTVDKSGLCFVREDSAIRGFIGAILNDELDNYGIPKC